MRNKADCRKTAMTRPKKFTLRKGVCDQIGYRTQQTHLSEVKLKNTVKVLL